MAVDRGGEGTSGKGTARATLRHEESLSSPRGRIDFQTLASQSALAEPSLPCIHHRRDENSLINRVLLAGLKLAATLDVDRSLRVRAGRLADLITESVSPIRLDRQVFGRLERGMDRTTRAYEPAISLIRILADAEGVSLSGETGPRLPGFFFDMNRFFQALLGRFLVDNLPDHSVHSEHRLKGMLAYVPGGTLTKQAPVPDLTSWYRRGRRSWRSWMRSIGISGELLPREMLYQLAIYATIHE